MVMLFPGGLGKALTLSYDDGVEQEGKQYTRAPGQTIQL